MDSSVQPCNARNRESGGCWALASAILGSTNVAMRADPRRQPRAGKPELSCPSGGATAEPRNLEPGKPQALQMGAFRAEVIAAYRGDSPERRAPSSQGLRAKWKAGCHYPRAGERPAPNERRVIRGRESQLPGPNGAFPGGRQKPGSFNSTSPLGVSVTGLPSSRECSEAAHVTPLKPLMICAGHNRGVGYLR